MNEEGKRGRSLCFTDKKSMCVRIKCVVPSGSMMDPPHITSQNSKNWWKRCFNLRSVEWDREEEW